MVTLLRQFDWQKSILRQLNDRFHQELNRPISQACYISDEKKSKLLTNPVDLEDLCDISDFYYIVLNPEITNVDDWDFEEQLNANKEIHYCKLWINWFLPVYYIETTYEKGLRDGEFIQTGPLKELTKQKRDTVNTIISILSDFDYKPCKLEFLKEVVPNIKTDLKDKDVTFFNCLFSDLYYYETQHIRKTRKSIADPYDSNLKIGIVEYLNDSFEVVRKERTLYYNSFGSTTIVTDNDQKVKEVICRGYIDGIPGNEKVIKIGN